MFFVFGGVHKDFHWISSAYLDEHPKHFVVYVEPFDYTYVQYFVKIELSEETQSDILGSGHMDTYPAETFM